MAIAVTPEADGFAAAVVSLNDGDMVAPARIAEHVLVEVMPYERPAVGCPVIQVARA